MTKKQKQTKITQILKYLKFRIPYREYKEHEKANKLRRQEFFFKQIIYNNIKLVKILVDRDASFLTEENEDNLTGAMLAKLKGYHEIETFLKNTAENQMSTIDKAFFNAIENKDLKALRKVLVKANLETKNAYGFTAYDLLSIEYEDLQNRKTIYSMIEEILEIKEKLAKAAKNDNKEG